MKKITKRSGVTVGRHLLPFAGVGMPRSGATHVIAMVSALAALACGAPPLEPVDGDVEGMDGGTTVLPDGRVVPIERDGSTTAPGDASTTPRLDGSLVPTGDHCDGPCACSNGIDDDGDGLIDADDPECTGPTDDDEATFGTGIPGDNRDGAFQDCFFDGDSGHGNDGCQYRTGCLYGELPPEECEVSELCLERCRPAVPNGCDCFGCCTVHLEDGRTVDVLATSTCSVEDIDDPSACTPCTPHDDCSNTCGRCELCPGRTADDLPADCFEAPDGGTPPPSCEEHTPCDVPEDCEADEYCSLGCCLGILI